MLFSIGMFVLDVAWYEMIIMVVPTLYIARKLSTQRAAHTG